MEGEKSQQRSARTFLFRMFVGAGAGIVIPVAIAGVIIGAVSTFQTLSSESAVRAKASSSTQSSVSQSQGWPMLLAGSHAEASRGTSALISKLNPEFGELTPSQAQWLSRAELSVAGYPLGRITYNVPACLDPRKAKEAAEAWQSGDTAWMGSLVGCYVLGTGLTVEWMSLRDRLHRDQTQVRLKSDNGGRAILYISPITKDRGILESPINPIMH